MATTRVQLALNVTDLAAATRFYARLFGDAPVKERPGYANFAIADPPLKLVLFEDAHAASPLNHLGVELPSSEAVAATAARFTAAGLSNRVSEQEHCCHAVQDKVWVDAPDVPFNAWEFYTVVADDPTQASACDTTTCCAAAPGTVSEGSGPCCS